MLFKATRKDWVQRWGCEYSCLFVWIGQLNKSFSFFWGFPPSLEFQTVGLIVFLEPCSSNTILFPAFLTALKCLRSLQIVRQMSLFTSTLPSGWVLTTCPSVDLAFESTQVGWGGGGGGRHMAFFANSFDLWLINKTCHLCKQRRAPRLLAALVWPVSFSYSSVQPWMSLCAKSGKGHKKKRLLCILGGRWSSTSNGWVGI